MTIRKRLLEAVALLMLAAPVQAETTAIQMPGDTKLVVFQFDPNNTYTILTRPNSITNLQLGEDEQIAGIAVGDSIQWQVEKLGTHIFVKPLRSDLVTSGTIVTNRRAYQITLQSVKDTDRWYQRVTWKYPETGLVRREAIETVSALKGRTEAAPAGLKEEMPGAQTGGVDINKLNFDYRIDGEAAWRPNQVFDDGRFTWIRFPSSAQEVPAIFALNNDDDPELVNFVVKNDYIIVQRVLAGFLLKIGRAEVRVRNNKTSQSLSRWFR